MFENYYRSKKVLVTGHTGFKGTWLCEWLLEMGAQVAGISIDIPTDPSLFEELELKKRLKHYVGDIRGIGKTCGIFDEFKPEIVFHMAAQSLVRASYDDPKSTFDTNVGGTVNVLEAIRKTPSVRSAVIVTSDKCYENLEKDYAYREGDRLGGLDPYSASKACAEIVFHSYFQSFFQGQSKVSLSSARAGNVIGGGDWASDRIIPDCVRAWSKGKAVGLRNPESTRPWQHVLEPLSGYLWLAFQTASIPENFNGQSFNFGPDSSSNRTVSALVDEMKKTWPKASWEPEKKKSDSKKEASLLMLNCEKASNELKWKPVLSFEQGVQMTADWYRSYYQDSKKAMELTRSQIADYAKRAKSQSLAWAR